MKYVYESDMNLVADKLSRFGFQILKKNDVYYGFRDSDGITLFFEGDRGSTKYTVYFQVKTSKKFALWMVAKASGFDTNDNSVDQIDYLIDNIDWIFDYTEYQEKYDFENRIPDWVLR